MWEGWALEKRKEKKKGAKYHFLEEKRLEVLAIWLSKVKNTKKFI